MSMRKSAADFNATGGPRASQNKLEPPNGPAGGAGAGAADPSNEDQDEAILGIKAAKNCKFFEVKESRAYKCPVDCQEAREECEGDRVSDQQAE